MSLNAGLYELQGVDVENPGRRLHVSNPGSCYDGTGPRNKR